jgi:glycosyltransferase involved in cell wall biosynthesis
MSANKPKVALVLFTNLGVGAGTEIIAKALASEFVKENLASYVSIVQTDYMDSHISGERFSPGMHEGIDIEELRSPLNSGFIISLLNKSGKTKFFGEFIKNFLYFILNFGKINKILSRVDKIIFLSYSEAWTWFLLKRRHKMYIISGECDLPTLPILKRIMMSNADKIHYLTSSQMNKFDYPSNSYFIVPNGINSKLFIPEFNVKHENESKTRVLYVGRLEEGKGILEILEAAEYLKTDEWLEITIVGIGSLDHKIKKDRYKNIKFVGYVPNDRVSYYYSNTDIFLFPTHGEPYGTVVLEAISSGAYALVSSNLNGYFDDLKALGALEYIDNNASNIAKELVRLKGFRLSSSKKDEIHQYIEQNYSWNNIAKTWMKCIID